MAVRIYSKKPRVYFDMDGVLADFEKECKKRDLLPKDLKLLKDAYLCLEVIEGAIKAVHAISDFGFEIFVMTKPPSANPYSATEKILWLKKYFPIFKDHIIITPDKGAVGTKIDYLIDDHPEWANANNFPGTIIKFDQNWDEIVEYFDGEKKKIKY